MIRTLMYENWPAGPSRNWTLRPDPPRPAPFAEAGRQLPPNVKETAMTFVVTENCIRCKYTDCVDVCPTDCFHEGPNFLVINPETCIDCSLCVAECPA